MVNKTLCTEKIGYDVDSNDVQNEELIKKMKIMKHSINMIIMMIMMIMMMMMTLHQEKSSSWVGGGCLWKKRSLSELPNFSSTCLSFQTRVAEVARPQDRRSPLA